VWLCHSVVLQHSVQCTAVLPGSKGLALVRLYNLLLVTLSRVTLSMLRMQQPNVVSACCDSVLLGFSCRGEAVDCRGVCFDAAACYSDGILWLCWLTAP
jgi:hypothetical protein